MTFDQLEDFNGRLRTVEIRYEKKHCPSSSDPLHQGSAGHDLAYPIHRFRRISSLNKLNMPIPGRIGARIVQMHY
jgi:hypothetical protein